MKSIAVVGGGAAGITAAIAAARRGARVSILEGGARVGKKILSTGNGRCNLSNANAAAADYHGEAPEFILGAAQKFWVNETLEFFDSIGVLTRTEEDGKIYPYTNLASSVLDALRLELARLGVRVVTGFEVCDIIKKKNGFAIVSYSGMRERADNVLIATGGKAAPSTGSKGGGYALLEKFGHTATKLRPALVQLKTEQTDVRSLKGIKINARVTCSGKSRAGEVLFTEYGLSGPPIFYISSYVENGDRLFLDIMPEYSEKEIEEMLFKRAARGGSAKDMFVGMMNKRVALVLIKRTCSKSPSQECKSLSAAEIAAIAKTVKGLEFTITSTMSWNNAQVTRGGIRTEEFDPQTLESKKIPGIFAAGEVLDIDGDCGGYNLQWAWTSGYVSGCAMSRETAAV